ncbi:hypothetical protein FQN50_005433, partial [Emmonsiellopsis sp. PD_5]
MENPETVIALSLLTIALCKGISMVMDFLSMREEQEAAARQDELEARVDELEARVEELQARVGELKERLRTLEARVKAMEWARRRGE